MIAKARAISHGANSMRYVVNKDKADIIKLHLLPDNVAAESLWSRMLLHQAKFLGERSKAIKNNMIRIEVSPTSKKLKAGLIRIGKNLQTISFESLTPSIYQRKINVQKTDIPISVIANM